MPHSPPPSTAQRLTSNVQRLERIIPFGKFGQCRADSRPQLHRVTHIGQRAFEDGELGDQHGRVHLPGAHVREPEELLVEFAIAGRNHHAVLVAHQVAQAGFIESLRRFHGGYARRGDLLAGGPEVESERLHPGPAGVGDQLVLPGEPLHPDFQRLGEG